MRSAYRPLVSFSALLLQLGMACGDAGSASDSGTAQAQVEEAMPVRTTARPALCQRAGADKVRDVFCGASMPSIQSLTELEHSLGLTITARVPSTGVNPVGYYPAGVSRVFATLLSHSTALSGRFVSELNPRVILMTEGLLLAFTRGVQQVEIAAQDRDTQAFNFYLLSFEQVCNAAAEGCSATQRFGPYIESGWVRLELRDAEQLKNSPDDCRQCHQRGLDRPALLMRELNGPWTHFFSREDEPAFPYPEPTGGNLMQDFLAAHGDESYAGLPSAVLRDTQPFSLRKFADVEQPLLFDALAIVNERWAREGSSYPSEPRRSATWDAAFNAFKRGEQLALPYFAPRATDPAKAQRLTAAYQRFAREGAELPDLSDVFPDAAQTRAEIGLQVEPGAPQRRRWCRPAAVATTMCSIRRSLARASMSRWAVWIGPSWISPSCACARLPLKAACRLGTHDSSTRSRAMRSSSICSAPSGPWKTTPSWSWLRSAGCLLHIRRGGARSLRTTPAHAVVIGCESVTWAPAYLASPA